MKYSEIMIYDIGTYFSVHFPLSSCTAALHSTVFNVANIGTIRKKLSPLLCSTSESGEWGFSFWKQKCRLKFGVVFRLWCRQSEIIISKNWYANLRVIKFNTKLSGFPHLLEPKVEYFWYVCVHNAYLDFSNYCIKLI